MFLAGYVFVLLALLSVALCPIPAQAQDQAFKTAFGLYRKGSVEEARQLLLGTVERHPSALDLSLLGSIEFERTSFGDAERYLKQALALEPGLIGTRFTLGRVLDAEGKTGEARAAFEQVVAADPKRLNPNYPEALLALARLDVADRQLDLAAKHLTEAQKSAPQDVRPLLALARVRNLQGNSEGALALALRAKSIAPQDASVLYTVGVLCLQMDLNKDATGNLERAAELNPNESTLYALASAHIANRDFPEAIKIYQQLHQAAPNNAQFSYALGASYFLEGDSDSAQAAFEESMAAQPGQVESVYYLGLLADRRGDKEKSVELFKTVIERQPDHARAHIALGLEYRSLGRLTDAKAELETATRLDPSSQKAHYQLGLVLAALKEEAGAKGELATANRLRASSDDKVSWELATPAKAGDAKEIK